MHNNFFSLQRLLWIDGIAAICSGLMVFLFRSSLSVFLNLPQSLLKTMAFISVGYAAYSLHLALRKVKPLSLLKILVLANSVWAIVCLSLMCYHFNMTNLLGKGYFLLEALFVAGLALLEWEQIKLLRLHISN